MEPTVFKPFGESGPKVVLCGMNTGDWNVSNIQGEGDHKSSPGLFFRFNKLANRYRFSNVLMPVPTDCNTRICSPKDLNVNIQNGVGSVVLRRGIRADGMVLYHGSTGALATADCPTIVAYCSTSRIAIVAHGGYKSLIDVGYELNDNPPRQNQSVVDEVMKTAKACGFCHMQVFVTCGISGENYAFPDLVMPITRRFGKDCVSGIGIDLKKVIAKQFFEYGVHVTTDLIDTYGDRDARSNFVWYSSRRGKNVSEKAGRNLVLVVN